MKRDFSPSRLDVRAFAEGGAALEGDETLSAFSRLAAEAVLPPDAPLRWRAQAQLRAAGPGAQPQPWLHLEAHTVLPLTCQRCLEPVATPLAVDRWFRFVADEAIAAAQDEEAEEDVLALSREFDLRALIEDELLMALPLAARHAQCPVPVPQSVVDPGFETAQQEKAKPFAVLDSLRRDASK